MKCHLINTLSPFLFISLMFSVGVCQEVKPSRTENQLLDELIYSLCEVRVKFNVRGDLEETFIDDVRKLPNKRRQFYSSEIIQNEIDAVNFQRRDIKRVIDLWELELEKQFKKATQERDQVSKKQAFERFFEMDKDFESEILELLLPHQQEMLKQFQARCLLRQLGFPRFLSTDFFLSQSNLAKKDIENVCRKMYQMMPEIRDEITELKSETISELLAFLTESEKEQLMTRWPNLADSVKSVEMLRIQLLEIDNPEKRMREVQTTWSPFLKLAGNEFTTRLDGTLTRIEPSSDLGKDDIAKSAVRAFLGNYDENLIEVLGLNNFQIDQIDTIADVIDDAEKTQLSFMLANDNQAIKEKLASDEKYVVDSYYKIKKILTTSQWECFESFVERRVSNINGPFYDFTQGALGKELELNASRIEDIAKSWSDTRKKMEKRAISIESKVYHQLIVLLPTAKSQSALKQLLGPPPVESPPNLDLLLQSLGAPRLQ